MTDDDRYPIAAPGWEAIDRALARCHPGVVPHQYTSRAAYDLDGTAPLPAIAVHEGQGPAHWHYVGYGCSELFEKTSPDARVSGMGFELTFSIPRGSEQTPPTWPLALLHGIAGHVLAGRAALDSGHVIDLGAPLSPSHAGVAAPLTGVVCVPDPRLGKIDTPHGSVLFLALFGLTDGSMRAMRGWPLPRVIGLVADVAPLAITDPARAPLAEDPATAAAFRRYALGVLT